MNRILICDDEADIVNALVIYLKAEGYETVTAANGREAVQAVMRENFQLVIMDIMMPEMDGITAMQKIREQSNVPVILLTAKGEDNDKILGLNVGADDYVTKPFNPVELVARVKSQLRRYVKLGGNIPENDKIIEIGLIVMNDCSKEVTCDGEPVSLTPTEYDILKLLMTHPDTVFSPKEIYSRVWNDIPMESERTVAVHIRHIREKIEIDPANPRYLKVVWAKGYKMVGGV